LLSSAPPRFDAPAKRQRHRIRFGGLAVFGNVNLNGGNRLWRQLGLFATNRSGHEAVRSAYPDRAWPFGCDRHGVAAIEFGLAALLIKLYLAWGFRTALPPIARQLDHGRSH
jgi:hypothetical protein